MCFECLSLAQSTRLSIRGSVTRALKGRNTDLRYEAIDSISNLKRRVRQYSYLTPHNKIYIFSFHGIPGGLEIGSGFLKTSSLIKLFASEIAPSVSVVVSACSAMRGFESWSHRMGASRLDLMVGYTKDMSIEKSNRTDALLIQFLTQSWD